jgi:GT2 family glycosyltransferase
MLTFKNNVLVEFEYQATVRPIDSGVSRDPRVLAIGFVEINFYCASTGENLGRFDFRAASPPGSHVIYGLSHQEAWGVWSIGERTAILFSLNSPPKGPLRIEIAHIVNRATLPLVLALLRVNKGEENAVSFEGGVARLQVDPDQELGTGWRQRNCSNAEGERPRLSILILNYERPDLTFAAVTAILSAGIATPYEIIVVDNASSPILAQTLAGMELPVRLVRLEEKRSFGAANNIAAEAARGEFLLILNNDVFLPAGAVEKLMAASSDEGVGAAGPVLLNPDGTLQEIGGFVAVDGHTFSPIFNGCSWDTPALSDVDYVSAACLMVRRTEFLTIGGFAPEFEQAYSEDVDFCLRLRAIGKRTRLVKLAGVPHIRGATTNDQPETRAQIRNAKAKNLDLLRSRWGRWLATRDKMDAPEVVVSNLDQLQRQIAQFPGERLNCVIAADPLGKDANSRAMVSTAVALGNLRPTLIATAAPYSVIDLCSRASAMGLSHDRLTAGAFEALEGRDIDVVVLSTCAFPATPPRVGRRRVQHCPFPIFPEDIDVARQRLGAWLNFDAIVTESEFSRRACLQILDALGAPSVEIGVIPTGVDVSAGRDDESQRSNIILSVGPMRPGPAGGGHEAVLRAFHAFRAARKGLGWRLVIAGDFATDDAAGYVGNLRDSKRALDVDILVSPPRSVLRRLFLRARIYASAQGLGLRAADFGGQVPHSAAQVARAVSAGCVPVVFAAGAEAEFCDSEGLGFRFRDERELLTALDQAAALATSSTARRPPDARLDALSHEGQTAAWAKLVAGFDPLTVAARGDESQM